MPDESRSDPLRATALPALEPDAVIERLAALAEQDTNEAEFHQEIVRNLVEASAGLGAAVWMAEAGGFRLAAQHHLTHSTGPTDAHHTRLHETLASESCRVFRDSSASDALAILCPWRLDEEQSGVLELCQKASISEAALAGQQRFVSVVAELLAAYHRNDRMVGVGRREQQWREIDRFAQAVHRPLDLEATAYAVANEGRRIVECDRLTVLVRRRGRWQVISVSGSDYVNRRSSAIAHLEQLARLVAAHEHAVWSGGREESRPAELEDSLDDYHEVSAARLVGFLPLAPPSVDSEDPESHDREPFAVLVFECFDQAAPEDMAERCDAVRRHSSSALQRSLVDEEMPLRGVSRLLNRSAWVARIRRQPWTLVLAVAAIGMLLALGMVPVSLRVEATGSLQPRTQRHLFAPVDCVVEGLLVSEVGQHVEVDEELIQLRDPELHFEAERVLGELETARKQLAGIEAERLHADRASRSDLREAASRSADEESLKKQIEGLERQQQILETHRERLNVRSPIRGQVLTWDAEQLLQSRPVGRGQILLTVADLEGTWVLELEIPDDRIADITKAMRSQEGLPAAHFILATAPETRYVGRLESIAPATDVRSDRGPTVFAVVLPEDQQAMRDLRPGASVVAKVDCGRRSLLYVMTRGLLRTIRSRVLF